MCFGVFEKRTPGSLVRSKAPFPFLSRRQMEFLLFVVTGRPEHLHQQTALPGAARAAGTAPAPGQRVLLLPAAGLVLRVVHAPAPDPCVQPEQGRVHCGRHDHRGTGFGS